MRGFAGVDAASENGFLQEAREVIKRTLEQSSNEEKADYGVIKEKIRQDLKRYINKNTQRRPLIMPVILEILTLEATPKNSLLASRSWWKSVPPVRPPSRHLRAASVLARFSDPHDAGQTGEF